MSPSDKQPDSAAALRRFEEVAKHLFAVPKDELDEQEQAYEQRSKRRNRQKHPPNGS